MKKASCLFVLHGRGMRAAVLCAAALALAGGCSGKIEAPVGADSGDPSLVGDRIIIPAGELSAASADGGSVRAQWQDAPAADGDSPELDHESPEEEGGKPEEISPPVCPREQLSRRGVQYNRWAFIESAGGGDAEAVELFLLAGMNVDVVNSPLYMETALMWAARGGHVRTIELLIDAGAEVSARNKKEMTALGYALMFGHRGAVELLREAGARR